ncbi:isoprenylcysteine carboxylmethyltransferase family protein [Ralstonia insidiosa]|mgnify:FL=1|jgi:protein-S-isoprenylcysteine O-methyltransferase Ste14|uniref:Isoprenylcysteine carboxyl methyltransferase n=1 Tax=Ralstonia insidiosa TaxID=190721 RepID=A0A191ZUY5_9RALS|nr:MULTISPECIES: isoprenylcysteine carboxylmethyltransferase family protein [Ralstonia]ANH74789.1 phospholipid methyltransferase family protein [Ralstonia insidiosa]ANJ71909.1 isoprenylcysteine carboxyl methyltransferase [Ralstonia insidiosa]EPX97654.1 isoprenylcysteine carboxyl methyltransferase [Ralstonia sp. AU12-08]KAB0472526.1 isoprenylcysteine carboxylmethyltransferase family protein [Ralstonia insidiosa]MBY4703715.1 isoprenylcysteine carboxylmethyltransferase family protein [Ralstonia i
MAASAKLGFGAVISVLGYLALAAWGWGGVGPLLAHPARVALVVVTVALTIAALFAGGNLSAGEREDRSNRWVLPVFGLIGIVSAWLPAYTDRHDLWCLDGDAVRWLGVVLYAAGGALRLWPVHVLGNRFSGLVAIQPGHTLVTGGIYQYVRNPSYLGLLVSTLGWGLGFRALAGVVLTLLLIPPLVARMRAEEALLQSQFGAAYDAYRARTWRLIPGLY